jgi:hypothetical protein
MAHEDQENTLTSLNISADEKITISMKGSQVSGNKMHHTTHLKSVTANTWPDSRSSSSWPSEGQHDSLLPAINE